MNRMLFNHFTPHPQSLSPLRGEGSRIARHELLVRQPTVERRTVAWTAAHDSPSPLNGERAGVRGEITNDSRLLIIAALTRAKLARQHA